MLQIRRERSAAAVNVVQNAPVNVVHKRAGAGADADAYMPFGLPLTMSQPHCRKVFTTLGVMAAVRGTRMKMRLLWIA